MPGFKTKSLQDQKESLQEKAKNKELCVYFFERALEQK